MPQNTKDRMKEITDSLEQGIRDVFESGKYETYLKTMSRFHSYSMNQDKVKLARKQYRNQGEYIEDILQ